MGQACLANKTHDHNWSEQEDIHRFSQNPVPIQTTSIGPRHTLKPKCSYTIKEEITVTGYCRNTQFTQHIPEDIIRTIAMYSHKTVTVPKYIAYSIVSDNEFEFQFSFLNEKKPTHHKHNHESKYRMLLLGADRVGKHTLFKQLRHKYGTSPLTKYELQNTMNHILVQNTIEAMMKLAVYSKLLDADPDVVERTNVSEQNIEFCRTMQSTYTWRPGIEFTEQCCHDFQRLWDDIGIRNTAKYSHKFGLPTNYKYYFDNMHNFWRDEYVPTFNDYIHAEMGTSGIKSLTMQYTPNVQYELCLVGQRGRGYSGLNLMQKCSMFDDITVVLFVVDLNGYNQREIDYARDPDLWRLRYEPIREIGLWRMDEDIDLFGRLVNLDHLDNTHFVLLLNKCDLFQETLKQFGLNDHWKKDFKGDPFDEETVIKYFLAKYLSGIQNKYDQFRYIHCLISDATDTDCVAKIMHYIHKHVLMQE
eukprot:215765_1